MTTERQIANHRAEDDYCERGTQGCCIDHTAERTSSPRDEKNCETW